MARIKDWKIILGLTLITLMLVAMAFSMGVYVGKNGWLDQSVENLKYANQRRPNQGAFQQQNDARPQPDVLGRLMHKGGDMLTVNTAQGVLQVMVNDQTAYLDEKQQSISLDDLKQGDNLAIFGSLQHNGQTTFMAETVLRISNLP
ncbi:MAG: hypothetical protein GYA18_06660 [Chloroflexi bacterium]|nr:hypothetical protein [Chloroflexota bacterium]